MSGIDDILKTFSQGVNRDASGKIVGEVLKGVPLVMSAAEAATKAAIKIVTKR
jgi:hypothetical protein